MAKFKKILEELKNKETVCLIDIDTMQEFRALDKYIYENTPMYDFIKKKTEFIICYPLVKDIVINHFSFTEFNRILQEEKITLQGWNIGGDIKHTLNMVIMDARKERCI